jgi:L-iditol 2-dehydrogenase/threonine 3-dehydrogenase
MKQAVMTRPGVIEIREVSEPVHLDSNEIKLKIQRIGVCGSDIHVYHGKHPFTSYPVVQGHEYSGEVVAVGESVTVVQIGDKATARPQQVCGKCGPCLKGDYNICNNLKVE